MLYGDPIDYKPKPAWSPQCAICGVVRSVGARVERLIDVVRARALQGYQYKDNVVFVWRGARDGWKCFEE